jgi:ABC-type xylose transport system permease subunit
MVEAALSMTTRPASWSLGELWKSRTVRTLLVLLSLWALLAIHPETREAFLTSGNFSNVTAQVAEIVIIGVGMTFIVLTGGIDLSVGAGMALFGVVAAVLQIDQGQPAWIAISAALAISIVVGLWHGLLVTRLKVPPFIATLTGFLAYRGLALLLSGARGLSPMGDDFAVLGGQIGANYAYGLSLVVYLLGISFIVQRERRRRAFGLPAQSNARIGVLCAALTAVLALCLAVYREGMPVPVLIAAVVLGIGGVLLRLTRLGRYAFAIGGNAEAARLSGVPVTKVKVTIYLLTALLTALAGVVSAARTNGVTPGNMGLVRELHVITAVVIGGTSLSGGRATMLGTLLGALIFGTLSNGMNLLNVDSNWQLILTGVILLGASLLDSVSSRTDHP